MSVVNKHAIGHFKFDMLRKRIKYLPTVYRMGVVKTSEASVKEIHTSKLDWFTKADAFLNDATASRKCACH